MSLALVTVSTTDFDVIHQHLLSHNPRYSNMHMREACQRNGKRDLRYLHAMRIAPRASNVIEGMISGPCVYWRYQLVRTRSRTQLNVLSDRGAPKARARLARRFMTEIMRRIAQERAGSTHHPRRTPGQFYLRRSQFGSQASHPNCRQAVTAGVLDSAFVSQLASWDLQLLRP